jgi:opacity protein-like surface antigen
MNARSLVVSTLSMAYLALPSSAFTQELTIQPFDETTAYSEPADFNREIYYKNKLELGFEAGYLPYNSQFIFQFLEGEHWAQVPLNYTLVPLTLSLRWQLDDIGGPWILRGNTEVTFSGNYTAIPHGPESYYAAILMGARYNFVQPNWRVAPYLDARVGCGYTDSKGPDGVLYAQGENFAFTFTIGGGLRYNFNPRYSVSAGYSYMHISNLYLSRDAYNYGINVFGPTVGINIGF